MLQSVIDSARRAASRTIATHLGRAVVAVPFLVAAGFATAAATLALVEHFGEQYAYWILALCFTLIGLVASLVVSEMERENELEDAAAADQQESAVDALGAAAEEAVAPAAAMLLPLLTSPLGLSGSQRIAKLGVKYLPVLMLAVLLAAMLWPLKETAGEGDEADGSQPQADAPA